MVSPWNNLALRYIFLSLGLLVLWFLCANIPRITKRISLRPKADKVKRTGKARKLPLRISLAHVGSIGFMVLNVLLVALPSPTWRKVSQRSALLSTVNLIPIILGQRFHLLGKIGRIPLAVVRVCHRIIGLVMFIEMIIHVAIKAHSHSFDSGGRANIGGLMAAISITITILSIVLSLRHYETFVTLHRVGTLVFLSALLVHIPLDRPTKPAVLSVLIAVGLRILFTLIHIGYLLHRNLSLQTTDTVIDQGFKTASAAEIQNVSKSIRIFGNATAYALMFETSLNRYDINSGAFIYHVVDDALHLHIRPSRLWDFRPGQYVYLCLPAMGITAFAQSHPFYVAWIENIGTKSEIVVLVIRMRSGFTKNLISKALSHRNTWFTFTGSSTTIKPSNYRQVANFAPAIVDGPYGGEVSVGEFETVVLVATDIGIVGHLPYIEHLLKKFHLRDAKVRRIILYWEIDSELQATWASDRLTKMLHHNDRESRLLDIKLFIAHDRLPFSIQLHQSENAKPSNYEESDRSRLQVHAAEMISIKRETILNTTSNVTAQDAVWNTSERIRPSIFPPDDTPTVSRRSHGRVEVFHQPMNITEWLEAIMKDNGGSRIMILTCVDHWTGSKIRNYVSGDANKNFQLQELEFQPPPSKSVRERIGYRRICY